MRREPEWPPLSWDSTCRKWGDRKDSNLRAPAWKGNVQWRKSLLVMELRRVPRGGSHAVAQLTLWAGGSSSPLHCQRPPQLDDASGGAQATRTLRYSRTFLFNTVNLALRSDGIGREDAQVERGPQPARCARFIGSRGAYFSYLTAVPFPPGIVRLVPLAWFAGCVSGWVWSMRALQPWAASACICWRSPSVLTRRDFGSGFFWGLGTPRMKRQAVRGDKRCKRASCSTASVKVSQGHCCRKRGSSARNSALMTRRGRPHRFRRTAGCSSGVGRRVRFIIGRCVVLVFGLSARVGALGATIAPAQALRPSPSQALSSYCRGGLPPPRAPDAWSPEFLGQADGLVSPWWLTNRDPSALCRVLAWRYADRPNRSTPTS